MKKAIAVGFIVFVFATLTLAQSATSPYVVPPPRMPYWQQWSALTQGSGTPYVVPPQQNFNYLLQQYYSPQNQQWQSWQQQNQFQQQYQWQQPTWNSNGWTPSSNYMYQNGYEPEVYAPQIYQPGGNVLLEPGDDNY